MDNQNIFAQILDFLFALFSKGQLATVAPEPKLEIQIPAVAPAPAIDWSLPECKITEHFTVADACMLHSWNRLANEDDGFDNAAKNKIVALCEKMEDVRKFLGCPVKVHCMFRSQKYNQEVVKAIPNDVHAQSLACDFDCNGHLTIDEIHAKLEPVLESMGIRMERNTPTWVHIDLHPVVHARYFTA